MQVSISAAHIFWQEAIVFSEPMTVFTDLLITAFCWQWAATLRRTSPTSDARVRQAWMYFFIWMGISTLIAGMGHGFSHTEWKTPLKLTGGVFSALATFAMNYTAIRLLPSRWQLPLRVANALQLVIFLCVLLSTDLGFAATRVNTAVGLLGVVLPIHWARYARTHALGSKWVLWGITSGFVAAIVSVFKISLHEWFTYHDLGHICVLGSMWVLYRAAKILLSSDAL